MVQETPKRLGPLARCGLIVALAAGAFFRLFFISSHGAWDMDYWKAWANETVQSGLVRAYGPPDSVPPGEFLEQAQGKKPRWEVSFRGRDYTIDYPPLTLCVRGASWAFFTSKPRPYRGDAAENLAAKFPAVLGDLLSAVVLLWAFRGDPRRASLLAAAYWIFPMTWISSAVHGNFDGFVAPFLLVSLLLAGSSPFLCGATFAVACLIKPTGAMALPVLFLFSPRRQWPRVIFAGLSVTALVFAPYVLAGTFETALVHIARIYSQERISGGYANPWWLLGQASLVNRGLAGWRDPIDYVLRTDFELPLGLIGLATAALAGSWILWTARRATGPRAAAYTAALLLFAWSLLTVGVHDNHNHAMFLLLMATGLATRFLRVWIALLATSTMLGSLCLHGLGRFYGPQWRGVLPITEAVSGLRMAAGFDLTMVLSVLNTALFLAALVRLRRTLLELQPPSPAD